MSDVTEGLTAEERADYAELIQLKKSELALEVLRGTRFLTREQERTTALRAEYDAYAQRLGPQAAELKSQLAAAQEKIRELEDG